MVQRRRRRPLSARKKKGRGEGRGGRPRGSKNFSWITHNAAVKYWQNVLLLRISCTVTEEFRKSEIGISILQIFFLKYFWNILQLCRISNVVEGYHEASKWQAYETKATYHLSARLLMFVIPKCKLQISRTYMSWLVTICVFRMDVISPFIQVTKRNSNQKYMEAEKAKDPCFHFPSRGWR